MAKLVSKPYTAQDKIVTPTTPDAKAPTQIVGVLGVFLMLALLGGVAAVLIGAFRV